MPIYEYEHLGDGCQHGKHFELQQSIYSDKFTRCPYCGQEVKRLISLVSVNTPKGKMNIAGPSRVIGAFIFDLFFALKQFYRQALTRTK